MIQRFVLNWIARANDRQLERILSAAMDRKRALHPDWEIRYLAVPGTEDTEKRRRYEEAWRILSGDL